MEKLKFKPIDKGLGFHPFADGLPYAPVSKNQTPTTGSGAVLAGPPRIAIPTKPKTHLPRPAALSMPATAPAQAAAQIIAESNNPGMLYLFKRLFAYLLDSGLNILLCAGAFRVVLWKLNVPFSRVSGLETLVMMALFMAVFNWALIAAQEIAFGTTAGKRLFGLTIEGDAPSIFLRSFFFAISFCFLGLGLVWALFDKRKRCWHDAVVDIQPVG